MEQNKDNSKKMLEKSEIRPYAVRCYKSKKARKELLALQIESANKSANKFSEIDKTSYLSQAATVGSNSTEIGEKLEQPRRSKLGRPLKIALNPNKLFL